ncbi:MAG TPA: hypothetical protein VKJ77_06460, partial [Caballeronia sp.]|nr:hypothetical protein [Caballeronia sp.]
DSRKWFDRPLQLALARPFICPLRKEDIASKGRLQTSRWRARRQRCYENARIDRLILHSHHESAF